MFLGFQGGALYDVSGHGHDGTLTDFTLPGAWGLTERGWGLLFDASSDYVDLGSGVQSFLASGSPFAVSWWERSATPAASTFYLRFGFRMSGSTNKIAIARSTLGDVYNNVTWGPSPSGTTITSSAAPSLSALEGVWAHFVITGINPNSTTTTDYTLYVNAVPYATSVGGTFSDIGDMNRLGYLNTNSGTNGYIDDIRIYNRILTADEVSAMYADPFAMYRLRRHRVAKVPLVHRTLGIDAGAYSLTGTAASLTYGRKVAADAGSYALSGQDVAFRRTYVLAVGEDSYVIAGTDANLIATVTYVISAEAGSYGITGTDAALKADRVISADGGSYELTGSDVLLKRGYLVAAGSGVYAVTGDAVTLLWTRRLAANAGSYALTGRPVTLVYSGEDQGLIGAYIPTFRRRRR